MKFIMIPILDYKKFISNIINIEINIISTKKQPAIPIPPSRNNIKNLQNKAAKESKSKII